MLTCLLKWQEEGFNVTYNVSVCSSSARFVFLGITFSYKIVLQVIAIILAFSIRKVKIKGLNDSREISAIVYATSIILVLVIVMTLALRSFINVSGTINGLGFSTASTVALGFIFIPKVSWRLFTECCMHETLYLWSLGSEFVWKIKYQFFNLSLWQEYIGFGKRNVYNDVTIKSWKNRLWPIMQNFDSFLPYCTADSRTIPGSPWKECIWRSSYVQDWFWDRQSHCHPPKEGYTAREEAYRNNGKLHIQNIGCSALKLWNALLVMIETQAWDLTIDSRVDGSVIDILQSCCFYNDYLFLLLVCYFIFNHFACVRNNRNTKQMFCTILGAKDLISYNYTLTKRSGHFSS